jgi:hypothetical protein
MCGRKFPGLVALIDMVLQPVSEMLGVCGVAGLQSRSACGQSIHWSKGVG